MKTLDFIRENIGKEVYLTPDGDILMGLSRKYVGPPREGKVSLILEKLTKGGMAYLKCGDGHHISVPPSNVRLVDELK